MKRRVLSFVLTLALCLNLCPVWVLAAGEETGGGICPHHQEHTAECGYAAPSPEQECTHSHDDGCYVTETSCTHQHTAECAPEPEDASSSGEPVSCAHECTEDSGCVTRTLSCQHEHDGACGYAPEDPGAPCAFICRVCPIEDLIGELPDSVSERNSDQVQAQIEEIYALYDELTDDERQLVDLSPCASLWEQADKLGAVAEDGKTYILSANETFDSPYVISKPTIIDTKEFTLFGTGSSAVQVTGTGDLEIRGKVESNKVGVEVLSGGTLRITEPGTNVKSGTYALDIASGGVVQLSAGEYYGKIAAIRAADNNFADFLAPGYAYFDENGSPILPENMATVKANTVVVGECTDHTGKTYKHTPGTTEHTWTCPACGTEDTEPCTFDFEDKNGTCALCGNTLTIEVDENDLTDLVYDGTIQPEDVKITVTLTDGSNKVLVKGTDYEVKYEPRKDAGEIKVTVTGITFNGTFTKTYTVDPDRPVLAWDTTPVEVDYDGEPVEASTPAQTGDLPPVKINILSTEDNLQQYLQYSYKKQGDADYTDGLPTNAGTYDVIVSLPEMQNFEAAVSAPITLTINQISPITTAPKAAKPTYNGEKQELVTAGVLDPVAVADGLEIQFSVNENGTYSTTIPTGTNAWEGYTVWYKVVGLTGNYIEPNPNPAEVSDVVIQRKPITPMVELSQTKYQYDGDWKEPVVTVKDGDTVLPTSEYTVTYENNRDVSTADKPAKVIVADKTGGNYDITEVTVTFQITLREQAALSITGQPRTVTYGDQFPLVAPGGSGNGEVTWAIIAGSDVATVNPKSGQITIVGDGEATVRATKSGKDPVTGVTNYEDAIATWPFTASKKSVTAIVTAEDKPYDTNTNATVHAVVEEGVLSGDEIIITGLTGTFDSAGAGVDKTVKVDTSKATITGKNSEHYAVSYSSTTVKATIHKAVAKITTPPVAAALTYDGTEWDLIAAAPVVDPAGVPVEYALSKDGPYSTDFPKATNAGTYTVWYRIQETDNYTGEAPQSVTATIAKKSVVPVITLDQDTFIYNGDPKEPVVTLTEADGTTEIPAGEYTVAYSNNINVGTAAAVTVTAKPDGNYSFTDVTKDFTIEKEKAKVTTAPEAVGEPLVFNTRAQKLVTAGAGTGGTMVYSVDGENGTYSPTIPTKTNAGDYTVHYKVQGDSNHSDSDVGSVVVTIAPKTVKDPTITLFDENGDPLVSYTYDGSAKEPQVTVVDGSTPIDAGEYEIRYENNTDAGNTATVNIIDKPGGNYTVSGSKTFVIQKANIVFNPAPSAAVITYDGKAHELLVPGTTSGGEVLYALNSATSRYDAAIPQATLAGDYTVYYKVVGDKNHNDFAVQSVDVTIQRKELTDITIELTPDSFEYDGTEKLPTVTVKDGKTVLPEEEYTWECDVDSPTNQGTYTITIEDAPGGNYDLTGVTPNTATFTIGKTAQAPLVIEDKPTSTVYGDTFTLTTSGGSSSSAVTWSVTGPATVDKNTGDVEITGVGEVTITATNPGDQNYLPVSDQWTFTAEPKPVTASVVVGNKAYDGTTSAAVTTADIDADLLTGDTVTIDPASITAAFDTVNVGTGKTVTLDTSKVQVTGDTAKYDISYPDAVTANITQATTRITTEPTGIAPLTYTGEPQELVTAGKTNVGFLVYSLDGTNFSPDIPTGTNAGTYNVYYKVDGTADYTGVAVNTTPISVTIGPKSITPVVELSESSFLYDGTKKEPKVTVKDGKTVIGEEQYTITWANDDTSVTDGLLTSAGTYTATIENVPNGNYSFTVTAKAEIVPAEQAAIEITGQPAHVYYGDRITSLGTSGGTGEGTVKWSVTAGGASAEIDEDSSVLTIKGTGSVTVKAERTVPNYGPVSAVWTFTVEPKPVLAEVTVTGKVYDGTTAIADADIAVAVKASDLVDSVNDVITITAKGTYDNANVGIGKTVTLSDVKVTADADKYSVAYPATAKGDITPRGVAVTVTLSGNDLQTDNTVMPPAYSYDYDGTEKKPNVTVTANDDNAVLADSDYSVGYANNKNVGDATVTVTAKEGGNYTFADVEVKFAIKKTGAELTKAPAAKSLTYTGQLQDLVDVGTATGGTVVYSKTGADSSYSETIPQETNAGTYTVYYMVKGDDNHADTEAGQVSVTIKPKEITPAITLEKNSYEYDGNAKTPGVTVKDGTDTIDGSEYSVSYRDNINAGTATVIVSNNNGGNYIVNGTATFEITKKAPTFTAPAGKSDLQYNGEAQELVTAGVCGEGTVEYSVNGGNYSTAIPVGTAVGTYTIDYKVLGDANHSDTAPVQLTVEIGKNKVTNPTITLSSNRFTYNGNHQEPTITVYDNNNREIPKREYTVTITGTKSNNMVDVDTYTVTITTPDTSNYVITDNGTVNVRTFEIVPADQESISITGTKAQVYYGDTIQLGVTGGTGAGTISWKVEAKDGSAVSSTISTTGLLTVRDVGGPYTVTVTRTKDNYGTVSAEWEFSVSKKPVTAVLTGVDKPFDGNTTATVKAKVAASDLVFGDTFTIPDLTGTFDNANAGTNKTITITGSAPTISDPKAANYNITYPATATASILTGAATVDTDPEAVPNLTYDASKAQELVTAGTVTGGTMVYSLDDGTNFSAAIPKAKDAGKYTVYFKAQGDGNHTDSEVKSVQVTIDQQTVASGDVQIELTPPSAQYDGNVKRPEVVVRDKANNVIPKSEYKVTYVDDSGENWTNQGTYTVKVENITGGNYVVETATADFIISTSAQAPLEIVNKPGLVHYGDTFTLSAVGGSGNSAVKWSSSDENIAFVDDNGFVTIKGVGPATITATKPGGSNYDTVTADYPLNALKKPVTAIVTADDKVYNGDANATLHVTWEKGALVGNDEIKIETLTGTFEDEKVGTNKKVTVTCKFVADATYNKYDITIPPDTTASILKAEAEAPSITANTLTYNGSAQDLVTGGTQGTTLYSDTRDGVYTATVPTGTNAKTYTVWYKAKGDANHNDSQLQAIQVTISRKPLTAEAANTTLSGNDLQTEADGTYYYQYDGSDKTPSVIIKDGSAVIPASEYTVSYSDNKNVGEATVTITNSEGGNYIVSGSVTFEIRKGGAELVNAPQPVRGLTYTGQAQELVTGGTATGGHIEYALDGGAWSEDIPKATNAGTYTVTYKAVGDGNHEDGTKEGAVTVTISPKEVISPKVTVSGGPYTYDGSAKEPGTANVKVEDGGNTIPDTEYALSYRDNVNAGTATVIVTNANGGNYIVNGTGTFVIAKGTASVATAPKGLENLPYNSTEQALIEAGTASNGTMVYSLSETGEYTPAIPTGKAVGSYTVWYKAQGDSNHGDSEAQSVTASIAKNTVTAPTIQVTPETATYTGEKQEPAVTVKDDAGIVIDGSEYTVTYSGDLINVGQYTLTITEAADGNYAFTPGKNTAEFEILPADQTPLTITGKRERVYYGDTIQLGAEGGNGTVTWKVDNGPARIDEKTGLLTITGVGSVTVTATSTATGYDDQTATWPFYADKKQVTAVVTAADRAYNGDTDADLTVTISSGLVSGDSITGAQAEGHFTDKNVGENKTVVIDSLTFPDDINAKYDIVPPVTVTATIFKADVDETKVTAPTAAVDLEYTGLAQALVAEGSSPDGAMEYSLDGKTYSASLPTGTNAGDYEVWYRVKGDGNHNDTAGTKLTNKVTIDPQTVDTPIIEFTPNNIEYDGKMHKPAVTVKDNEGSVIPGTEYEATYDAATDWISVGAHKVTVTDKDGGNYTFDDAEATFTIRPAGQGALSIVNQPGRVQYGDSFTLAVSGGTVAGDVTWASSDSTTASIDYQSGLVTVHKSGGPVTITAERTVAGYETVRATWTFSAGKKSVTPIVTARDKVFDGDDSANLDITWQSGDLLNGDTIPLNLTGKFSDANVGTNKTVTVTGTLPADERYDIKLPPFPTASITPKAASLTGATNPELTYNGNPRPLVSGVTATNGTLAYSRNGTYYTLSVPKETNAGTYTVWYKAQADADGNYKDSPAVGVEVTIKPREVTDPVIELSGGDLQIDTDGTYYYEYDGSYKTPSVIIKDGSAVIPASEYTVGYSDNRNVGDATVTVTDNPGGNYSITEKTATFTIRAGAPAVTAEPEPRNLTYNGREQTLVTRGAAVNGHMEYSFDEYDDYGTALPKEIDAGVYEVWYKVVGDDGTETIPELVIAEILPKTVIPTVTVSLTSDPLQCTGSPLKPPVIVVVENKTLTNNVDYTVTYSNNIKAGTATVTVQSVSGCNYQFSATAYFEIVKGKAEFLVKPSANENLFYTGEPQALVTTGITQDGLVLYSTDGLNYSPIVPTKTERGNYSVIAKVQGNDTHEDSDLVVIPSVKIDRNQVQSPTVALSENSMEYTGTELKPTVTVTDKGKVIPAGEYTVSYSNNVKIGEATVTVTGNGDNYTTFTATAKFQIVDGSQPVLTITGKQDSVVYGDTLRLGATGGTGAVTWSSSDTNVAAIDSSTGVVTTKKSGSVTITAASGSLTDTWTFTVAPKPVTAVVIAAEKPYDNSTTATLTVTLSGLVAGDNVDTVTATGHFMDANVGTNKTVIIESLTIPDGVKEKYSVTAPATTTGNITPAAAKVTDAPKAVTGLTYTGLPKALVTPGTAEGGNLAYSLDGTSYSYSVPTAVDAGSYTVWYKAVAGDDNHKDSAVNKVENVTIGVNRDTPTVLCTPDTFQYDSTAKTPTIVVRDSQNRIIPESEYTVELPDGRIAVKEYEVTVTDKPGGNYEFTTPVKGTFKIVSASQNPLSIITSTPTNIHYGDSFRLSAMGGSGSGAIKWSIKERSGVATIGDDGVVTVIGTGGFTVEAYREAADGYNQSNTASVAFEAKPKPVTPVVTAADKPYDGTTDATLTASWKSGDLVGTDTITLTVGGAFATADAGTGKRVDITSSNPVGESGNYMITWPDSTTASIYKVDAKLATAPTDPNLTYNGSAQNLVTGGTTVNGIGVVEYSTSEKGAYSTTIPTGTEVGKYTVWYKVADSVNYTGIPAASIEVEIKKAAPKITTSPAASGTAGQLLSDIKLNGGAIEGSVTGKFAWEDGSIQAVDGTSYNVIFTPDPDYTANYNTVTIQVQVTFTSSTSSSGGNTTNSTPTKTTVQNGTASTVVSAADGRKLVRQAAASQSSSILIKPEITGDVNKSEVSIPASTVSQIERETNAALTVSAPIADVTIPQSAMDTLSRDGGTVKVVTEQVEQGIALTLTAGGKAVENVPGGVTLAVPAADAGPGTVAVLVHEDGTRETIRKSVVENGAMNIPLSGSATVEIVDNSKSFADVADTDWSSDAVAFASAHELFSGTSETTFSPDQAMSRGMLATVLYNLEGRPDQAATGGYSDVSSDAWYADGVAWAAGNGIASGYGDGQFGPDDSITREQFVVMLWKYAGSPKANSQSLDFTDADQASAYAQEALCWAVEQGILSGYTDGQLAPGGTATRAQAAQMLKSFMSAPGVKL
ncbi:hypothetical protein N510_002475 [Firmicutes bacterium ASF500]|nr:hypothetical protein N510_002475 [Firmicutes bacterium ASF500]